MRARLWNFDGLTSQQMRGTSNHPGLPYRAAKEIRRQLRSVSPMALRGAREPPQSAKE